MLSPFREQGLDLNVDAPLGSQLPQGLGRAASARPEPEVLAHHHQAGLELPVEHLLDKGFR